MRVGDGEIAMYDGERGVYRRRFLPEAHRLFRLRIKQEVAQVIGRAGIARIRLQGAAQDRNDFPLEGKHIIGRHLRGEFAILRRLLRISHALGEIAEVIVGQRGHTRLVFRGSHHLLQYRCAIRPQAGIAIFSRRLQAVLRMIPQRQGQFAADVLSPSSQRSAISPASSGSVWRAARRTTASASLGRRNWRNKAALSVSARTFSALASSE